MRAIVYNGQVYLNANDIGHELDKSGLIINIGKVIHYINLHQLNFLQWAKGNKEVYYTGKNGDIEKWEK